MREGITKKELFLACVGVNSQMILVILVKAREDRAEDLTIMLERVLGVEPGIVRKRYATIITRDMSMAIPDCFNTEARNLVFCIICDIGTVYREDGQLWGFANV